MTGHLTVSGDDLQRRAHPWNWWQGQQLEGDLLVLALETQALDSDVVAVLDVVVETVDDRPRVAITVLFGPASAGHSRAWHDRFLRDEANPRFQRLLGGQTEADGFEHRGPGHWQLQLLSPTPSGRPA